MLVPLVEATPRATASLPPVRAFPTTSNTARACKSRFLSILSCFPPRCFLSPSHPRTTPHRTATNCQHGQVYRKIKKRQRDRAGDSQLEADGELGEVAARKRAEERMSLRHKVPSLFAETAAGCFRCPTRVTFVSEKVLTVAYLQYIPEKSLGVVGKSPSQAFFLSEGLSVGASFISGSGVSSVSCGRRGRQRNFWRYNIVPVAGGNQTFCKLTIGVLGLPRHVPFECACTQFLAAFFWCRPLPV